MFVWKEIMFYLTFSLERKLKLPVVSVNAETEYNVSMTSEGK